MKIPPAAAIHLLHRGAHASLATHSTQLAGYPYATPIPCVPDARHRPTLCLSALAEHCKNLRADPRCSMALLDPAAASSQSGARLTLLGDMEAFQPTPLELARHLRYQPEAEDWLQLDFAFYRLRPQRLRYIEGFGRMGWLEAEQWLDGPTLEAEQEAELLTQSAALPAGVRLLGADCHGIDYEIAATRRRLPFPAALEVDELAARWPELTAALT
ncbi:HugZ family protein [Chromobacterium haemolyticum]|uniref:HugZ family pyridoxamine 5'-phosphate oxidase n=1 Tax=Chromobacterium haemolyticum TaxID=394935 RepID=UPI0009DADB02|nr:pyridoxamine 5'-phosphate oxidase family protein [Chromobacterium haemolyticum]OQS44440.1 pyridoxamine 5'-phosphate oxidase [Chromobacterium haemolyticum]